MPRKKAKKETKTTAARKENKHAQHSKSPLNEQTYKPTNKQTATARSTGAAGKVGVCFKAAVFQTKLSTVRAVPYI